MLISKSQARFLELIYHSPLPFQDILDKLRWSAKDFYFEVDSAPLFDQCYEGESSAVYITALGKACLEEYKRIKLQRRINILLGAISLAAFIKSFFF